MKGLLLVLMAGVLARSSAQECNCRPEQRPWYKPIRQAVMQYCPQFDPNLVVGIIAVESCGRQRALNQVRVGTTTHYFYGYMQVGDYHFATGEDPYATSTNLTRGCRWLARCWNWAEGNTTTALMCYTGGMDVSNWGYDTVTYPDKVFDCMPRASPPTVATRPPFPPPLPPIPKMPPIPGTANSTPVYWDPSCGWRYTDGSCRP
jgi:hypothetical protein